MGEGRNVDQGRNYQSGGFKWQILTELLSCVAASVEKNGLGT